MGHKRWRSGRLDACRKFVLSSTFQLAMQLAFGLLLCSLVVVVPALTYFQACIVSYLYLVVTITTSPNNHMGTRITAAVSLLGPMWLAAALAGIVGTLSRLTGDPATATAVEAALSCIVFLFLSIHRVGTQPPMLWGLGMVTCLGYGLTLAAAHNVWPIKQMWQEAIVGMLLSTVVAAGAAVLTTFLILPSLASDAVQSTLSRAIRSAGHSTTSYATLLFPQTHKLPRDMQQAAAHARSAGLVQHIKLGGPGTQGGAGHYMFDWQDVEGYMAWLEVATRPTEARKRRMHVAATPGMKLSKSLANLLQRPDKPAASGEPSNAGTADADIELGMFMTEEVSVVRTIQDARIVNDDIGTGSTHTQQACSSVNGDASAEGSTAGCAISCSNVHESPGSWPPPSPSPSWNTSPSPFPSPGSTAPGLRAIPPAGPSQHGSPDPKLGSRFGTSQHNLAASRASKTAGISQHGSVASRRPSSRSIIALPAPTTYHHILRDPSAAVLGLRPLLAGAAMMLNQARVEPALLRAGRPSFAADDWAGVLAACQLLVTRLAALETLLEEGELVNEEGGYPLLPGAFRLVFAQLAASLNRLADAVDPSSSDSSKQGAAGAFCSAVSLFGRTWEACREELLTSVATAVQHHWQRVAAADEVHVNWGNVHEIRLIMYTWILSNGLIQAAEELEEAVTKAVCGPGASAGPIAWERRDYWGWVGVHTSWLGPLVPLLTNQYLWANWRRVFTQTVPAALRSRAGLVAQLRDRYFQAGLKYWGTLSIVLAAVLVYLHAVPNAAHHSPITGFVGATLCLSERVEATASKVSFWLLGCTLGAVLGLAAMWHPTVATNPYLLVLILVVAAAAVGLLGRTLFRITSVLFLMTLSALILCQYVGCCGATGTVWFFGVRLTSVCSGVLFAAAVSNLVLPWYTSAWALDTMASFLTTSMGVLQQMYDRFYADGQAAAAAARAAGAFPNHIHVLLSTRVPSESSSAAGGLGVEGVVKTAGQLAARIDSSSTLGGPLTPAAAAGPAGTASAAGAGGPVPVTSPGLLQSPGLAGALVAVQVSLVKDAAAWKRGVLATPPVVWAAHRQLLELLDALAALEMTLQQGPAVTGAFCGNAFTFYLHPLRGLWQAAMDQAAVVAAATATHLRDPSWAHAAAVKKEIQELAHHRRALAQQQVFLRQQLHERVWAAARMLHGLQCDAAAGAAGRIGLAGSTADAEGQGLLGPGSGAGPAAGSAGLGARQVIIEGADLMAAQVAAVEATTSSIGIPSSSSSSYTAVSAPKHDFLDAVTSVTPEGPSIARAEVYTGERSGASIEVAAAAMTREELLAAVGAVDDWVRYMGFQAAWVKVMNKVTAAARVTLKKGCQQRADRLAWIK